MAWRAGHKTECRQFAAARRQQLITERLGTGSDRIERFLAKLRAAVANGEGCTPSDLELLHAIQQTIKPQVSNNPGKLHDYLATLKLQAFFCIDTHVPLDRLKAEVAVKEIRWVLEEHIDMLKRAFPPKDYINFVKMGVKLLQRLGRRGEAAALGLHEVPEMEALVATGTQEVRRQVAHFFLELATCVGKEPEDGENAEEAQGTGRDRTQRLKGTWADHRVDRKDREEAEKLAKRALAVAEEAGVDEKTVRIYHTHRSVSLEPVQSFADPIRHVSLIPNQ
jgi:hypothetical protein